MDEPLPAGAIVVTTERLQLRAEAVDPDDWIFLTVEQSADELLVGVMGVRVEREEPTAEIRMSFSADPPGPDHGREAAKGLVDHLLSQASFGIERVVAFVAADDGLAQQTMAHAGLVPVAVDGDELVYYRRRSLPSAGS